MMGTRALSWMASWALICGLGCGASSGGRNSQASNAAGAGITAAIAAGIWVAGGGCKLQGCPWGSYCDGQSGKCVVKSCSDGCPSNKYCNEDMDRCEDLPSVPSPHAAPPLSEDPQLGNPVTSPIPYDGIR